MKETLSEVLFHTHNIMEQIFVFKSIPLLGGVYNCYLKLTYIFLFPLVLDGFLSQVFCRKLP